MSSSDITSILTEIQQNLMAEPLSPDQIAIIHDGVAEHGRQASVRVEILNEVTQLAQTITDIEEGFAAILRVLKRIDNKPPKINGERKKNAPAWEKLHNDYTALKTESQTTANHLKSKIQSFLDIIATLSTQDADPEAAQTNLSIHIQDLKTFGEQAKPIERRFLRLKQEVENFRDDLRDDVIEGKAERKEELEDVEEKIKKLQHHLDSTSPTFMSVWQALKLGNSRRQRTCTEESEDAQDSASDTTSPTDFLMAPAAIVALAPRTAAGFLSAALRAINNAIKISAESVKELGRLEKQAHKRDELKREFRKLEGIQALLEGIDEYFDDTICGLCTLQGIWRLLITDADSLQLELQKPTWNNARVPTIQSLYSTLSFVLDQYTLGFRGQQRHYAKASDTSPSSSPS